MDRLGDWLQPATQRIEQTNRIRELSRTLLLFNVLKMGQSSTVEPITLHFDTTFCYVH